MNLYRRRLARALEVERMRRRLLDSFPRLQMLILVFLTGAAGFLASFLMLLAGVDGMALRYLLAMGVAYIVFLLLLWIWLRTNADDYGSPDLGGAPGAGDNATLADSAPDFHGSGGTFDGAGASANVDFPTQTFGGDGGAGSVVDAVVHSPLSAVAEADEAAAPLAVVLLAAAIALLTAGVIFSSLFVVWSAPALFAEIMVDAMLSAGLYKRLRHLEPRNWLHTALRRTVIPFMLTTCFVGAAGWGMQHYAPDARSIGEVIRAHA